MCVFPFPVFELTGNRNCPLAKGQRPQEAQTRQQTLGPHKNSLNYKFKVNYNKLKNLLSNPSRPPTNRNRPNNTNRFKERKKDKKKK